MALSDLYNYVYGVRNTITDEVYTNVGSDSFQLGTVKRAFTEDNFQIEDADSGGNILIKDVDYELLEKDTYYTSEEGEDIYTKVKILNSFYQTGSLYITYDCIGSYIDKATIENGVNPVGSIIAAAFSAVPIGYLLCDGSAISRATYSALFAKIGETWGIGDGSTTFNIPDLRGAFLRGTGSHGTSTMANSNPFAGPSLGSFEDDRLQGFYIIDTYFNVSLAGVGATPSAAGALATTNKAPSNDGTNGVPRVGDETRPFAAGVKFYIRVI